jgi:hypothetical protein
MAIIMIKLNRIQLIMEILKMEQIFQQDLIQLEVIILKSKIEIS